MSPQLLLVLMVALITASLTGLWTRKPFYFLPVYWILDVCGFLIGQVLGRATHFNVFVIGQLQVGAGLIIIIVGMIGFYAASLWYTPLKKQKSTDT